MNAVTFQQFIDAMIAVLNTNQTVVTFSRTFSQDIITDMIDYLFSIGINLCQEVTQSHPINFNVKLGMTKLFIVSLKDRSQNMGWGVHKIYCMLEILDRNRYDQNHDHNYRHWEK